MKWSQLVSRKEALEGLGRNEYHGAIVIPKGYTERISSTVSPPNIPIAIVNEDGGAETQGEPINFGKKVLKRITGPDSLAPSFVEWTQLDRRQTALDKLAKGESYAAIVIPKSYSERLASLSGPPSGATNAPTLGGNPPKPESANMELFTSPAVRPATTGAITDAFTSIVGGVSRATSERILVGLSEQNASVPQGAASVISDPVRGEVSGADVSAEAGPLPKAPKPAEIGILTNPSAGPSAATPVQNISMGIVQGVSKATSERLTEAAGEQGVRLTPEVAAVIGDPVRADVTEAQPVGPDSGNGQSPFFLAFLANLSGLIGAAVVFFTSGGAAEALVARGRRPSRTGLWTVRLLLGLACAALVAGVELWAAFGLLGVDHEAGTAEVYLFLTLAMASVLMVSMLFEEAFGAAGIGITAVSS